MRARELEGDFLVLTLAAHAFSVRAPITHSPIDDRAAVAERVTVLAVLAADVREYARKRKRGQAQFLLHLWHATPRPNPP